MTMAHEALGIDDDVPDGTAARRRRVVAKAPPPRKDGMSPDEVRDLTVGPAPRFLRRDDWPERRSRLEVLWRLHRDTVAAESGGAERCWSFWAFDAPPEASRAGPVQDGLVSAGLMDKTRAALMRSTAMEDQ